MKYFPQKYFSYFVSKGVAASDRQKSSFLVYPGENSVCAERRIWVNVDDWTKRDS